MRNLREAAVMGTVFTALMMPSISWSNDLTQCTPCPFLNFLIKKGEIGLNGKTNTNGCPEETSVDELVQVGKKYGVDPKLMNFLASAVSEKDGAQKVLLSKLLDEKRRPAHLGSLARRDGKLSIVDAQRVDKLVELSTDGRITFSQLRAFQKECWKDSKMGLMDKAISHAEVKLLWNLFGAYRGTDSKGVETIPVNYVVNFLKNNELPENFQINEKDPATRAKIVFAIISGFFHW